MDSNQNGRTDHDLLIEVAVKLDRAIFDIKSLDTTFIKAAADKLDRDAFNAWGVEFRKDLESDLATIQGAVRDGFSAVDKWREDHEQRLRRVERWGFISIGGLAVIQFIVGILK